MEPEFLHERYAQDGQSGTIQRLELWEHYLIGYAQDLGTFVFDLRKHNKPTHVLAIAEYEKNESFSSLFLLQSEEDNTQAIIPQYDADEYTFNIHTLFDKSQKILPAKTQKSAKEKYYILRLAENKTPVVIDLQKREMVPLSDSLKKLNDTELKKMLSKGAG